MIGRTTSPLPLPVVVPAPEGAGLGPADGAPLEGAAPALGATLALALHQVFDLMVFFPKVGGFWWIVLGLGAGAIVAQRRRPAPAHSALRQAQGDKPAA